MSEFAGTHHSIEPSRRLIPNDIAEADGLDEYYSTVLESRVIEILPTSAAFQKHLDLASSTLALPRTYTSESGSLHLIIPDGAQTIRQILKPLSEDIDRYGPIFSQIGQQLGRLAELGYGLRPSPNRRSVLSSIGFAPGSEANFEKSIFFIPPYTFERGVDLGNSSHNIESELIESEHFTDYKIRSIMYLALLGFGQE